MEYKERIQWLKRYRDCLHQQTLLRGRIAAARDRATSLRQALSPVSVQSSPHGSSVEKAIETVEKFQSRLAALVLRNEETLFEIEAAIGALPTQDATILELRYLDGKTFQEIADDLGVVPRRVYQLHKKAVQLLDNPLYEPNPSA